MRHSGFDGISRALVLTAIVGVAGVNSLILLWDSPPIVDEGPFHVPQIESLARGELTIVDGLTMPRTYHAAVAALTWSHGITSLNALRTTSAIMSLFSVPLFWLCVRTLSPDVAVARTLQYLFLPVLFHLQFLVYTDALAMVPVMCALLSYLKQRYVLAGLFGILGVLTRQTHVVCLAILFMMSYVDCHSWGISLANVVQHCRRCWTMTAGLAGFVCFLVINGGVALGDAAMHPAFPANADNNCGFLLFCAAVFLPVNMIAVPQTIAFVRQHPFLSGFLFLTCFSLFVFGFVADHPYNQGRTSLLARNYVIELYRDSGTLRIACAPLMWWALMSIIGSGVRRPSARLIYPVIAVSLAFSWFVSPRYYIPGVAMILVFRSASTSQAEWWQAVWQWLLAVALLLFTAYGMPIV